MLVFQSLNGLIRLKPDLVEDLLPFLAYSALVPPAEFEGRSSSAMTTIAERNKRLFTDIFTTFFRGYAKEAPYAVAPMLRVLLFLRAQPQNGALGEFMSALDLLDVTKVCFGRSRNDQNYI